MQNGGFVVKQYYKIGEISDLYQIGPDSLRYYEKLGILTPKRGSNDYRMYSLDDLWRLNVIRDLRRLDFPMEKIKEYLNNRSIETTNQLLVEELSAIDAQIKELNLLRENVEERLLTLEDAVRQPLEAVTEKYFPRRRCHTIMSAYHTDEEMDMLIKQLLNKDKKNLYIIGNNKIGSFLSLSAAESGNFGTYEGVFIIDRNGSSSLEAGDYLSISYSGDSHQNKDIFPQLLKYAEEHSLRLAGPVLEILWVDIHQAEDVREHITELQIRCTAGK